MKQRRGGHWFVCAAVALLVSARGARAAEETPAPPADISAPVAELLKILRRKEPSAPDKLRACDRFRTDHPYDPLWGEVASVRHIFTARKSSERVAAARAYFRDYARGWLSGYVPELKKIDELNAFE